MNWVERRAVMEQELPEFWNLLCIEIEGALVAFRKAYATERRATVYSQRVGDCLHVTYKLLASSQVVRAIDVCLDAAQRKVFSRIEGEEKVSLRFDSDAEGKPVLVNSENRPMTNDEASESFLREFLFS